MTTHDQDWMTEAARLLAGASGDELKRSPTRAGARPRTPTPTPTRAPARPRDARLRPYAPTRAPARNVEIVSISRPASLPRRRRRLPVRQSTLLLAFAVGCLITAAIYL